MRCGARVGREGNTRREFVERGVGRLDAAGGRDMQFCGGGGGLEMQSGLRSCGRGGRWVDESSWHVHCTALHDASL
jgi:hypothetical protein